MGKYADLDSIEKVRDLCARAHAAQKAFAEAPQERVDAVVDAMAEAARAAAVELGREAHEETGYGDPDCKREKNLFSAVTVHQFIRPLRTVGILREDRERKVYEIAEPVGVVAAIIPSTNPTSTAIYKILIAVKARNGIVLSPHPSAKRCIQRTAEIMAQAAVRAGAPEGLVGCIPEPTSDATNALMRDRHVGVILATGGSALVKAAYSAGKPCFGVGPGNVPAYVHGSADPALAVKRILLGKLFDNGTLCSSEQAVIVDRTLSDAVVRELSAQGAHFLSPDEQARLAHQLFRSDFTVNPKLLAKPAVKIAEIIGMKVAPSTRVLVAPLQGVGKEHPLSAEKLSPVLAYYTVADWREGCERCKQILEFGGSGHTLAIHAKDKDVIFAFALEKPAFRIIANAPAATGAVGLGTGLDPAMTLGCGAMGGNITSDNITPLHLLNIKRLAFGSDDTVPMGIPRSAAASAHASSSPAPKQAEPEAASQTPDVRGFVDQFVRTRASASSEPAAVPAAPCAAAAAAAPPSAAASVPGDKAVDFVCEEDVRRALAEKRRILISDRTIITPSARDLGTARSVFRGS